MKPVFALSETSQVVLGVAGTFFGFLTTVATGIIGIYMAKINRKASEAAVSAEAVKDTLETSTTKSAQKLTVIHDLVNSAMLEQKRMYAAKCRAAANDTPTPMNLAEAEQAEAVYEAHRKGQLEIPSHPKNGPQL